MQWHHSRRKFVRWVSVALGLPLAAGLLAMLRRVRAERQPVSVSVPPDVPLGLSVVGAALVVRGADGSLRAFSNQCTHLGCRVDRIAGGEAVCPCHGSRYRDDGTVVSGPARRALTPLTLTPDRATGGWTARVS